MSWVITKDGLFLSEEYGWSEDIIHADIYDSYMDAQNDADELTMSWGGVHEVVEI